MQWIRFSNVCRMGTHLKIDDGKGEEEEEKVEKKEEEK